LGGGWGHNNRFKEKLISKGRKRIRARATNRGEIVWGNNEKSQRWNARVSDIEFCHTNPQFLKGGKKKNVRGGIRKKVEKQSKQKRGNSRLEQWVQRDFRFFGGMLQTGERGKRKGKGKLQEKRDEKGKKRGRSWG